MRVLVSGGRKFIFPLVVFKILDNFHEKHNISCIIHGGAKGVDLLADTWAKMNSVQLDVYPVFEFNWKALGKKAGIMRNIKMLNESEPDSAIVFPGGNGTEHMRGLLLKSKLPFLDLFEKMDA